MCACILPAGTVLGDTLNFVVPPQAPDEAAYWRAVLNSHAFEWLVRIRSAHNHLGLTVVGACAAPPWDAGDPECRAIARADVPLAEALLARRYGLDAERFEAVLAAFPKQPEALKTALLARVRGLPASLAQTRFRLT